MGLGVSVLRVLGWVGGVMMLQSGLEGWEGSGGWWLDSLIDSGDDDWCRTASLGWFD